LVTMATVTILNFFNPPKAATHYCGYSYKVSWKESKFFLSPLFCFHGNCGKVCLTDSDFYNCRVTFCYSTFLFRYYSSTHFCPLDFSELPWSNFMKPCRNIIWHVKLCF
jgi:hypothetical protein